MRLKSFTVKLVIWGSTPLAFVSGVLLSIGLNMITGLSLYTIDQWPKNGILLLVGSLSFTLAAGSIALLSWRIQPLKSSADVFLELRNRYVLPEEQNRSTEEMVWDEVLNAGENGIEEQKALWYPFIVSIVLFFLGLITFFITLPVLSS